MIITDDRENMYRNLTGFTDMILEAEEKEGQCGWTLNCRE